MRTETYIKNNSIYGYLDRGDGVCKYLTDNNLCSIYDNRPLICNIDEVYKQFFASQYALDEYYKLNYNACNELKNNELCQSHFGLLQQ